MGPANVNPNLKTKTTVQPPGPVGPSSPPGHSHFPPAQAYYGNLAIKPQYGKFAKDLDLISKMDPYVVLHVGEQTFKSSVCKNGGLEPVWNETLNVPINGQPEIKLQVLDKDMITKDGLIGEAMIPVAALLQQGGYSQWYTVFDLNKQNAGYIQLATQAGQGAGMVGQQGYAPNAIVPGNGQGQQGYAPNAIVPGYGQGQQVSQQGMNQAYGIQGQPQGLPGVNGHLTVKPQTAHFLKNADLFGKMDPYAVLTVGEQKF